MTLMWLNWSVAIINATSQLLDIYRLLFAKNDIVSSSFLLEYERRQMHIDKNRKFL